MAGFKARARALDMLGKQQISGIPTAISELFKNAYDAYADNVIVDYFRNEKLIVVRDDGIGMTKDEFENKWLTIGTESKVKNKFGGLKDLRIHPNKEPRPIMGEKGIGRLAIAMLGSQVLILTKANNHKFVASFINWNMFGLPSLNLEDIYVPVEEFEVFPNNQQIQQMIDDVKSNITKLSNKIDDVSFESIMEELNTFSTLNIEKKENNLKEPCKFGNDAVGTRFYILPSNPMIDFDLEGNDVDDDASNLVKMLIGFTDGVIPGCKPVPIKTHFRDYKHSEYFEDIISDTNFFSTEEFNHGEHFFEGTFNEYGQFVGKVKIFGVEQEQQYIVPWMKSKGKPTTCGPFDFSVMTSQGNFAESILSKEEHLKLHQKFYKFGGIYVYKDGIRILPYGNNKYDFLDVEYRRGKHAGNYFWAYKRLYGAVRLSTGNNDNLSEKAGREGFQESKAYHEMREILINFLIQTAKDFFQEKGEYTDYFQKVKSENIKRDELLKKEEKKNRFKKEEFAKNLNKVLEDINTKQYEARCAQILNTLHSTLAEVDVANDKEVAALKLINAESSAFNELSMLKSAYFLSKPRGISMSKKVDQDYEYYKKKFSEIDKTNFSNTQREIEILIGEKSKDARLELNRRVRISQSIERVTKDAKKTIQLEVKNADDALNGVKSKVEDSMKASTKSVEKVIRETNLMLAQTDFKDMQEEDIFQWRLNAENQIITAMENEKKELDAIKELLDRVQWDKDEVGNITSYIDVLEASDSKLNELTQQAELDSDLAQMGMAVHVINHEFDASIKMVRENLRRLKAWADVNQGLGGIYNGIRNSFDHLDSYLTLFTPLNRRLQRKATDIKGHEIEEFLLKLFGERLKRHSIELKSSKAFRQFTLNTFPSSIYPVFVNIVDNATYWIKGKTEHGVVDLDVDAYGLLISNNGVSIPEYDNDAIFDLGFTRKPGGRGLGLHISNKVLKEHGMRVELIVPKDGFNVTFRINKPKE